MICYLNGQFLPVEEATVSVMDRGFLLGDGLFETVPIYQAGLFKWDAHWQRLECGASYLGIPLPCSAIETHAAAVEVIRRNQLSNGVLRITLTRGIGRRGYSPKGAGQPTLAITSHAGPALDGAHLQLWSAITSTIRLPAGGMLNSFKHTSKLPQVLARAEADVAGADEAIMLNTSNELAEGASSNLFWIEGTTICTPPLSAGILAGVTRDFVIELCSGIGLGFEERTASQKALFEAEGSFVTSSGIGIAALVKLDNRPLPTSKVTSRIYDEFCRAVTTGFGRRS